MIKMRSKIAFGLGLLVITGGIYFGAASKDEISASKVAAKFNASTKIRAEYKLDNAALVKTEIKNAELDKYQNEPKDEIKITLGDKTKAEFTPDIEFKRWNETSFKIKPKGLETVATKDKDMIFEGDKVKFKTPKMDFEMFDVPATANDEGGYKYIWYLNEKPVTNKVEFDIETSGLDFFYQPPLNAENTDPNLTCTETQCKDAEGNIVFERPENVVGSYAVYHSTKGGMNDANGKDYKTGKAFHIFRPHIIDAVGKETWGILHIENGIYSVEIPQEFLDSAVYPIKSNDTFGYTTAGSGSSSISTDYQYGASGTPSAGTVTSITASLSTSSGNVAFQGAVYDGATTNISILTPKTSTGTYTGAKAWNTLNFTGGPSVSAQKYFAAIISDSPNGTLYLDTGGGTNFGFNKSAISNYPNWDSPINLGFFGTTFKYSIYATYTPSAGGSYTSGLKVQWFSGD